MNFKVVFIGAVLLSGLLFVLLISLLSDNPATLEEPHAPECTLDSDCGLAGFTGLYECRGSNIYGEYTAYLCANSECVEFTSMEFIGNCVGLEYCEPGSNECKRMPTTTVGPSYGTTTTVIVVYPSLKPLPVSTTTLPEGEVNCVRDSNCGIDHYGKPYCATSGHSVRDYIEYECINPGTYSSRCSKKKTTYLVDYCGFDEACLMGECVGKRFLNWYCVREDCCDTDFSACGDYSVHFMPFPIRGLMNETYTLEHNQTIHL